MISRVAENCFWLGRYLERADNTARLLRVNRSFVLDVRLPPSQRWHPDIVVSGEQERFPTLHPDDAVNDGHAVQRYLTWDDRNPVAISSSIEWARENARTIREVISLEMWETINELWHWMTDGTGRALYEADRDEFYRAVSHYVAALYGIARDTLLHEEPIEFLSMGMLLERANGTARLVDVKHHMLETAGAGLSDSQRLMVEAAHCGALLRSCSAAEPFQKRVRRTPRHRTAVRFLVKEPAFPRSASFCLREARGCLDRIRAFGTNGIGEGSARTLSAVAERLAAASYADEFVPVHEELTHLVNGIADICQAIHEDYFDPRLQNGDA